MTEPTTRADARTARVRLTLFILTIAFWNYALERMLWTFAQATLAVASLGAVEIEGGTLSVAFHTVPWLFALSSGLGAATLSLLKSIVLYARAPRDEPDDAELTEGEG